MLHQSRLRIQQEVEVKRHHALWAYWASRCKIRREQKRAPRRLQRFWLASHASTMSQTLACGNGDLPGDNGSSKEDTDEGGGQVHPARAPPSTTPLLLGREHGGTMLPWIGRWFDNPVGGGVSKDVYLVSRAI